MCQSGTADDALGVLRVQGAALFEQVGKSLVRPPRQPPALKVIDPRFQSDDICIEKDNEAPNLQVLHGGLAVHGTSSRSDNVIAAVKTEKDLLLDSAQGHVTGGINYLLQGTLLCSLDKDIGVNEPAGGQFCQDHSDRALARAGHTDKNNVRLIQSDLLSRRRSPPFHFFAGYILPLFPLPWQ